jgi:hypothetical protein
MSFHQRSGLDPMTFMPSTSHRRDRFGVATNEW